MTWQVYISISVVFYSFSTILQKLLLRNERVDPIAFAIFFQVVTGLILGVFAIINNAFVLPELKPLLFNLVILMVLNVLGNIFVFRSLQKIDASEFTVIFSSRVLFTIVASSIFLNEGLTLVQFFGALFLLVSVLLVSWKRTRIILTKYELFAVTAALCFGITNTNDRILLQSFSAFFYAMIAFVLPALGTIVTHPPAIRKMGYFTGPILYKLLIYCTIYAVSAIAFLSALQLGKNSSQVAAVSLMSVILTVILSIVLLGEKEHIVRKLIGAVVSIVGVLMLT